MAFTAADVDPSLCSHLIVAFAGIRGSRLTAGIKTAQYTYKQINKLKVGHPHLKTVLAVGGRNIDAEQLRIMLSSEANRNKFITTSVAYLRANHFDGLELDFVRPGDRGGPAEDKRTFTSFVKEIKDAFQREALESGSSRLLLSVAVSCRKSAIYKRYEVDLLAPHVDWFGLLSYDMVGPRARYTGLHAPLHSDPGHLSVDKCAAFWHDRGASKDKIVIGIATYGVGFTLRDQNNNGLRARTAGPSKALFYTRRDGFVSYYEICYVLDRSGVKHWLDEYKAAYVTSGTQWYSYEDIQSATAKVDWLKANGYAGYMVWSLDFDDFAGLACHQGPYPLTSAMNQTLAGAKPTSSHTLSSTTTTTTTKTTTTERTTPKTTERTTPKTTERTTPTTTTSKITGQQLNESFCRGRATAMYPHPTDCQKYVWCVWELVYVMPCPASLIWQPDGYCDWPWNLSEERKAQCGL